MKNHFMTIRMGAGTFTVTAHDPRYADVTFDINAMSREEKGRFFDTFRRVMNKRYGN